MPDARQLADEFGVPQALMTAFIDRFAPARVAADQFRASAEVMLFVHIPKTAGVSVGHSLRDAYDHFHGVEWNNIPHSFRQVARDALYRQTRQPERHVIMGHYGWPELQMFRNHDMPLKCGTFLRDPIARTISNYNYNCSEAHPANEQFRNRFPTLESYIQELPNDVQVTQSVGLISSLQNAMEKLVKYYSFIGVTEHLSASLMHLARSHGLAKLREYRKNIGSPTSTSDVAQHLVNQITLRCHNDKRLHDLMLRLYRA